MQWNSLAQIYLKMCVLCVWQAASKKWEIVCDVSRPVLKKEQTHSNKDDAMVVVRRRDEGGEH